MSLPHVCVYICGKIIGIKTCSQSGYNPAGAVYFIGSMMMMRKIKEIV